MTGPLRRSEGLSALARSLFNFLARKPGVVLVAALAIVFSGAAWGAIGVLNRYFEALDANLMAEPLPGVFCAGEMLDWEAPTGGYLLTACFASGVTAGRGVLDYLARR